MIIRITNHESRITNRGFTLIELLIAIILIVSGLIALMRMVSLAIFADSNLEYRLTALNLANEKLEELKDDGYNHANLATGTHNESPISGFTWVDQRTWTVNYVNANLQPVGSATGLKDIQLQVQWTQKGNTESVEVETLIVN